MVIHARAQEILARTNYYRYDVTRWIDRIYPRVSYRAFHIHSVVDRRDIVGSIWFNLQGVYGAALKFVRRPARGE